MLFELASQTVDGTLGKGPFPLGIRFAECRTRQRALGEQSDGEDDFAECLFSCTRQRVYREQKNTRQNKVRWLAKAPYMAVCRVPNGKTLGKVWGFAECFFLDTRQSCKIWFFWKNRAESLWVKPSLNSYCDTFFTGINIMLLWYFLYRNQY